MSDKKKRSKLIITTRSTPDPERQMRALLILRGYSEEEIRETLRKATEPAILVKSDRAA
jgi:SOS response regulatory protein OraA/RecX